MANKKKKPVAKVEAKKEVIKSSLIDTEKIEYSAFSIDTGEVLICVNAYNGSDGDMEYVEAEIIFSLTILPDQKMYVALYSDSAFFYGPAQIMRTHIVARFPHMYEKDLKEHFDDKVKDIRHLRLERSSSLILPDAPTLIIP